MSHVARATGPVRRAGGALERSVRDAIIQDEAARSPACRRRGAAIAGLQNSRSIVAVRESGSRDDTATAVPALVGSGGGIAPKLDHSGLLQGPCAQGGQRVAVARLPGV